MPRTNALKISKNTDDLEIKDHHRDTHAIPPQFIQEQYWHYNKIKISDLEQDESVVDWNKGLSEEQAKVLKPVSTISRSAIEKACIAFRNAALGTEGNETPLETEIEDVTVYEHTDFPGKLCNSFSTECHQQSILNNGIRFADSARNSPTRDAGPLDITNHAQIHGQS